MPEIGQPPSIATSFARKKWQVHLLGSGRELIEDVSYLEDTNTDQPLVYSGRGLNPEKGRVPERKMCYCFVSEVVFLQP